MRARDAGTVVHSGFTVPLPFERGAAGAQVSLHDKIMSNLTIYQVLLNTK